MLRFEVMA